jgi:hypothetical protein
MRQYVVNSADALEPGQPIPVAAMQAPEKKPGRGNVLNILQDAFKH